MNRNIIIIVAAAVVAFLAVLLIPRMLDDSASTGGDEAEAAAEDGSGEAGTGSVGSDGTGQAADAGGKDSAGGMPLRNPRQASPELAGQLAEAARQVNAGGPVTIDELTTMTAAESEGNRIRYRYEISQQLDANQVQSFRQFASQQNQQAICSRAETRQLIDMGGEIEYAYYGPGDNFLFSTPIVTC